ncbi:phytoene desaturase family protein [Poseidonibacter ostreae]|jgi:phytoene dehydrogenase-like protein|uniref:NAD(P)-binding protein n=1 Tax=Poseidonibacter ostreae TaxID=2654171 RepID=A0A6L4WQC3_9BACT|nr:NAD(P)-binding protein [Poseidonibacter ostreae]KAB7884946.1 NAD(P)-binding protein [Poseidonibacter ostreae]KAB7886757.1 NAD(P)-binding protein [Poseidonibacter ostreae]KAB7892971.1 NAD(P)-binding protein [Poseidonibacter ostreae]
MNNFDIAVIGSGMGGSLISALNSDKNLILFEKDSNLGGCGSTFKRKGNYYNSGATTFVGYEQNHPIKKIFDKANYTPDIKKSEVAIRVIQNKKAVDRVKDFDTFIDNMDRVYPHKNNRIFWNTIKTLDEKFWSLQKLHYAKYNFSSYFKTANAVIEILKVFKLDVLKSANSFIDETLYGISDEYRAFIDSQLLITIQTTSKDIPLLSLALGLSYPFHDVFYVNNGMGSLFDGLLKDINVHKKEQILKIIKEKEFYRVISSKNEYKAKQVILNSSIYDSASLFDDVKIKKYYDSFSFSDQSAFVINLTLDSKEDFLHHYQIILDKNIPNAISQSFFISFSSKDDEKLSKNGYSVTISTHTKAVFWKSLSKEEYKKQKEITQNFIINNFLENFESLKKEDIIDIHSATSNTFKKYINRYNCGGKAITFKNILQTPSCRTPFEGLFNVGDTIFAGQGWPGVAIGVEVLNKELNV